MARRGIGFNMHVLYTTRNSRKRPSKEALEEVISGAIEVPLRQLLKESDFVSLHVPLTPQTRHLIGAKEIALMKPGVTLVNTARGAIIDQLALYRALKSGKLGGAGLDVTDPEPIARNDPLLKLPNVVITPHIGSASYTSRRKMAEVAAENIIAVLKGELPPFCANPEVKLRPLDRYR
jgi:glyoxylate reductase